MLKKFLRDEKGEDLVEYALLTTFIASIVAAAVLVLRDPILAAFQKIADALITGP